MQPGMAEYLFAYHDGIYYAGGFLLKCPAIIELVSGRQC
jgi:hypothetical protein